MGGRTTIEDYDRASGDNKRNFIADVTACFDISELSGTEEKIIVSAQPWDQMTSLVSIPLNRIQQSSWLWLAYWRFKPSL